MNILVQTFRSELQATVAAVAQLELTMKETQERLRREAERAAHLRGLIAIYETEDGGERGPALPPPVGDPPEAVSTPRGGNEAITVRAEVLTKKERMERTITDLLRRQGSAHRAYILAHLTRVGVMGSEKDPMGQLAAYLSDNRDKFTSDGRGNFSLRLGEDVQRPATPNGSGEHISANAAE